jgi:hypothetical protein
VEFAHVILLRCISPLMALRSYAENDAQRPLLAVKADTRCGAVIAGFDPNRS